MGGATAVGGLALELELDAFEGPFDLLLTLVLREELALAELDLAEVVIAFVAQLDLRGELDLTACGEFLVLISALLELKARGLFEADPVELDGLEPELAAEELARRLALYRRIKEGADWLGMRLGAPEQRYFRLGPPPLPPARRPPEPLPQDPALLADALRALAREPEHPSTAHMGLHFPPLAQFLERWRTLLRRRTRLDFDQEVVGFTRLEIAVAFLALLELSKQRELTVSQAAPFAPIRIMRTSSEERSLAWSGHSA
jgi:segregation and condensation protein A